MSVRPFRKDPIRREALRESLFKEQGGLCAICMKPMTLERPKFSTKVGRLFATFEHIKNHRDGGPVNKISNLCLAHRKCNNERGARPLEPKPALLERLRRAIGTPPAT